MLLRGLLRHRRPVLPCLLAGAWALAAADSNVLVLYSNNRLVPGNIAVVRTIVETHGGRIRAENGVGEGAMFHVELPTHEHAPASAPLPT